MPLPSSGQISLNQVNIELSRASGATISLGESAVRGLFQVASGAISMSNGYGKANQFPFTISASQAQADLRTLALNAGWNGTSKVVATINGGVYIYSNSTGSAALTISGSFPNGVQLINNGIIQGRGGNGGNGGNVTSTTASNGESGGSGGTALSASTAVSITNNGTIAGGGGGGGGGGGTRFGGKSASTHGGGGGGGGLGGSSGGSGGSASGTALNYTGGTGGSGTLTSAGAGAAGGGTVTNGLSRGGNGGSYGSSGANGLDGYQPSNGSRGFGGGGGGAGSCTSGNANITWLATGTRYGALN